MTLQAESPGGGKRTGTSNEAPPAEQPLRDCLAEHLDAYFDQLDGEYCGTLYKLVIAEIEPPLFAHVLRQTRGNVSKAAEVLGIHRSTLRRKLIRYGLI